MSYFNMDHAAWAARQIGKKVEDLSPFHRKTFDILGIAFGGVYNAPISWDKVEINKDWLTVIARDDNRMATWDGNILTYLIFLCHEARIRLEIEARARMYFKLLFLERDNSKTFTNGHPNLDEAIADFRERLGKDHHIIYGNEARDLENII